MKTDRYNEALNKYNTNLKNDEITRKVNELLERDFEKNNNKETYKKIYSCIDLTSLGATDTREEIWKFTESANQLEETHPEIDNVAAICIYPNMIETVKEALTADIKIAGVAGGFPSSQTFTEIKIAETALAVASGADEIDTVINLGNFLEGNYEEMCEEMEEIKHACRDARLKVILETGALKSASDIAKAAVLALYSGADFIKTSTGKGYQGATPEAAYVICTILRDYMEKTGRKAGFKAAGGISTIEEAVKYYTIAKSILGDEFMQKDYFRIGASSLATNILKDITD